MMCTGTEPGQSVADSKVGTPDTVNTPTGATGTPPPIKPRSLLRINSMAPSAVDPTNTLGIKG